MPTKNELRRLIAGKKREYTAEALSELSQHIMCRLESHELFQAAHIVLLYNSLPDEVNTHSFISRWYKRKTILLPAVTGPAEMELRAFTGEDGMRRGAFNIDEPQGRRFENLAAIDIAVIPGVAFDAHGNRLGRGKGYYDRMLAKLKACGVPTIGVCFDFQKLPAVPAEEHDIAVDEVL